MSDPIRIAMWSGPRNISTAMMRAWENRGDTAVWDEPLYAFYLHRTGIAHPGAEEVVAAGDTDWRRVVEALTGPVPGDKPVFFQKHMTHHMLDQVDRGWLARVRNCFLIRDPREVIASYARTRPQVTVSDEMMPGVVSLPHGFGHTDPEVALDVATRLQPGSNSNQLLDEEALDPPSGTSVANGIPVQVSPL